MKRLFIFATIVALSLVTSGMVLAQSNPEGTWKLNVANSKYVGQQAPKNETRTYEISYAGVKVTVNGVAGDGSLVIWSYTTKYDGKDSPYSGVGSTAEGVGTPNGADTITVKRVDANTITAVSKNAGKVVLTEKIAVSSDGKVMTITSQGTNEQGQPNSATSAWDKQ